MLDLDKYTPDEQTLKRVDNNFKYHAPIPGQVERYYALREEAKSLALHMLRMCPASRELSVAQTCLEDAVMWANAAIARNETPEFGQE